MKSWLSQWESRLLQGLAEYPTRGVLIHGDARVANALATDRGVLLCDFDTAALAYPEADLGYLVVLRRRYGKRLPGIEAIIDNADKSRLELCAQVHEFRLIVRLAVDAHNPKIRTELEARVDNIRRGSPHTWNDSPDSTNVCLGITLQP